MSRRPQLIRLVGSCLCLLASAVFCHSFSGSQYHALVFGAGLAPQELPFVCVWLARYSAVLIGLPLVFVWFGMSRLLRSQGPSAVVELIAQTALVLALLLLIGCILAWQVPYAPSHSGAVA